MTFASASRRRKDTRSPMSPEHLVAQAAASPSLSTCRSSAPVFHCQPAARSRPSACDLHPSATRSLFLMFIGLVQKTFSACPVVVGGDFNVRYQLATDPDSRRLRDVLSSFDIVQHVCGATHRCGNILDLVMTFADR